MQEPLELSLEQAAMQLSDYLYPNNGWIGTAWINTDALTALAGALHRRVIALRKQREDEKKRKYPNANMGCGQRQL
jgi:hypothetical protein